MYLRHPSAHGTCGLDVDHVDFTRVRTSFPKVKSNSMSKALSFTKTLKAKVVLWSRTIIDTPIFKPLCNWCMLLYTSTLYFYYLLLKCNANILPILDMAELTGPCYVVKKQEKSRGRHIGDWFQSIHANRVI